MVNNSQLAATETVTPARSGQAQVLYDGQCPLCLKSVATLRRLDWLGRLRYVNVRDEANVPKREPSLDPNRLLEEMHLIPPDGQKVYHGFGAFRWMAWRLPLLWPVAPFLYLPGMARLGQWVYLWIARNRFRLVPCHGGVCALPPGKGKQSKL
jgi:predicted DCC family thiol-disulfide oxidoreductase YuxK